MWSEHQNTVLAFFMKALKSCLNQIELKDLVANSRRVITDEISREKAEWTSSLLDDCRIQRLFNQKFIAHLGQTKSL